MVGTDPIATGSVAIPAGHATTSRHTIAEEQPVSTALVSLPEQAGAPFDLSRRLYDNGVEQVIRYGGDDAVSGQNEVRVRFLSQARWKRSGGHNVKPFSNTASSISQHLRSKFSGVSMRRVDHALVNAYGPYGMAFGRTRGSGCLYGWQNVESTPATGRRVFSKPSARAKFSMTVRLCRAGLTRSAAQRIMESVIISADPDNIPRRRENRWGVAGLAAPKVIVPTATAAPSSADIIDDEPVLAAKKTVKRRSKTARRAKIVGTSQVAKLPEVRVPAPSVPIPSADTTLTKKQPERKGSTATIVEVPKPGAF
ncbi:MAG: cellulose biosynthesis protein BcsN [Pseudomonadota bacterium]